MKTSNSSVPGCRYCRHYTPEGRRGGNCQQLNVLVRGSWKACSLAIPIFSSTWESLEEIMSWQEEALLSAQAIVVSDNSSNCSQGLPAEQSDIALSEIAVRTLRTNYVSTFAE